MNINFYTFGKKRNSTAIPTSTPTTYDCKLKDDCSIIAPTITLDLGLTATAPTFNYAKISDFGNRYYFIDEWSYYQGLWTADLSIDVLATYKTQIGNSSLYVLRSASQYNNSIIDKTYPIMFETTAHNINIYNSNVTAYKYDEQISTDNVNIFNRAYEDGYFILGVNSKGNSNEEISPGINYYILNYPYFSRLMNYLMEEFPSGQFGTIANGIARSLYNFPEYIKCCYWIPDKIPGVTLQRDKKIVIGWGTFAPEYWPAWVTQSHYEAAGPLNVVNNNVEYRFLVDVGDHPQAGNRQDTNTFKKYLNCAPYTERVLSIMPFGDINIPCDKFGVTNAVPKNKILGRILLDLPSGDADLFLYAHQGLTYDYANDTYLTHTNTKWGVPIPISQTNFDMVKAIGTLAQLGIAVYSGFSDIALGSSLAGVGGIYLNQKTKSGELTSRQERIANLTLSGNRKIQGAIDDVPSAIGTLASCMTSPSNSGSTPGGGNGFSRLGQPKLYELFYQVAEEDLVNKGRPLCKTKTLNTLSGFIKCETGDISLSATQTEKELVRSYLVGGFYYE